MNVDSSATLTVASAQGARILAPDLARGMMLLFIALANVSAYQWGHITSAYSVHPSGEGFTDTLLASIMMVFIDGHVYPMFAFLFGYGITQFAISRVERGLTPRSVSRMLLRRHLWLLVFGLVHAILLFAGDILGAYALTGLILTFLLLRGSDRALRITVWTVGGVVAGTMLLGAALIMLVSVMFPPEFMLVPTDIEELTETPGNLMNGIEHYGIAMAVRVGLWISGSGGAVLTLIVPLAVLLGGFTARYRFLEGSRTRFSLKVVALYGITIGVVGSLPSALFHLGVIQGNELLQVGFMLPGQLAGIFGGLGYASLFGLIGNRFAANPPALVTVIASVGKRSLSFYLLQSIIFAPLLAAWALGFGYQLASGRAYLLAAGVWIISVVLAWLLERRNAHGPAEMLLRKMTYGSYSTSRKS